MTKHTSYLIALVAASATTLFLLMGIGALGVIGAEGDSADLMFLGVIATGTAGAIVARFEPAGMARAMAVTAAATMLVGIVAIVLGEHREPHTSVLEILGLTGMYASLYLGAAWLFRTAVPDDDVTAATSL